MKTKMKISKKEQQLLLILAIVVIVALYYFFVVSALNTKTSDLEQQISEIEVTKEQMSAIVAQADAKKAEAEQLKAEIFPIAQKYFGKTDQEEFIMQINRLNQASGLEISSIQFSEYATISLNGDKEAVAIVDENGKSTPIEGAESTETPAPAEGEAPAGDAAPAEGEKSGEEQNQQLSVDAENLMNGSEQEGEEVETSNIKLMQAQLEFSGTYAQVLKLLHEIDNNPKNIISSELTMNRDGQAVAGEKETKMTGSIRLSFYQVTDVDKYVQAVPGVLETNPLPKARRANPYLSYSWAWTKNVPSSADPLNIVSGSSVKPPTDVAPSGNPNKKQVGPTKTKSVSKVSLQNKEIFGFETGDVSVKASAPQVAVTGEITESIFAKGKKAGRLNYSFTGNPGTEKAYIDLTGSNITIKQRVEGIGFSVYSEKTMPHEVGLRMTDAKGQEYLIVFAKEVSWTGWKEILYDLHGIKDYPITVDGIYVEGKEGSDVLEGSLIFDNIFINVLQYE